MSSANPIIVVTGANAGVGFGICHRLLIQLSSSNPSDAHVQLGSSSNDEEPLSSVQGLILIMACRSVKKAESARTKLYGFLDTHIKQQRKLPGYDGHADVFRSNLRIEIHYLDLAVIRTIFQFGDTISQRYPYVSHLICNAGVASFLAIHWPTALKQLAMDPMLAVTAPTYYHQNQGELSVDGLGWVWQCNVFGHYCLFRTLQSSLSASRSTLGARVIWMSSIESSPSFYDADDWQLVKTAHSYESSKYQIDIIATNLDRRVIAETSPGTATVQVRHVVVQPGIVNTNISHALIGCFLEIFKVLTFYIARLFNSPHHTIQPFKAAVAAVHLSLISLSFIPAFAIPSSKSTTNSFTSNPQPVRFGSQTDRWGVEHVGITPVKRWEEHAKEGDHLVQKCDILYQAFLESEGTPRD